MSKRKWAESTMEMHNMRCESGVTLRAACLEDDLAVDALDDASVGGGGGQGLKSAHVHSTR